MSKIASALDVVAARISKACLGAQRAEETVRLLAVTKRVSAERIREAFGLGLLAFGENYVQEALAKQAELNDLAIEWHHIGPIQSNKTTDIATHFDWAQGVCSLKIAERLSRQRPESKAPLQVCVQVNVSGETSKQGCAPAACLELCLAIAQLPRITLRGLMALPAATTDELSLRLQFAELRHLFEQANHSGLRLDTLSMGMSEDLELAIQEGSSLVRVGSALFGERR